MAPRTAALFTLPLLGLGWLVGAHPTAPALPDCPAHAARPDRAPESGPPTGPHPGNACRAVPTEVRDGAPSTPAVSPPTEDATGYRHLGAMTDGTYSAVTGGLTVRDPGVRQGTHDFLATRFMARGDVSGSTRWLEAGWSENGWKDGAQHVYTYDTTTMTWSWYGQYEIHDGDRIHLALGSGATGRDGTTWRAWLWWGDRWNLLAAPTLPFGPRTQIEQYVEVYVDPARGGSYPVPAVDVDDVTVQPRPGDGFTPWRDPAVPTTTSPPYYGYCVDWRIRWSDWSARSC
ncbi:hypothetical protein [Actinocatenispora rupis]|uniref:GH16 domain-containing protein n=1 Tax=Actinocatenispora rupis TaxID=519421 RepID=A0A8J3NFP9_9ACTN|nr:hypothetical protein [Actinocatenispora rupis]GID15125.1 hypothetical protein Aru02nite_60140 [Actinocatenispora rupis]